MKMSIAHRCHCEQQIFDSLAWVEQGRARTKFIVTQKFELLLYKFEGPDYIELVQQG